MTEFIQSFKRFNPILASLLEALDDQYYPLIPFLKTRRLRPKWFGFLYERKPTPLLREFTWTHRITGKDFNGGKPRAWRRWLYSKTKYELPKASWGEAWRGGEGFETPVFTVEGIGSPIGEEENG